MRRLVLLVAAGALAARSLAAQPSVDSAMLSTLRLRFVGPATMSGRITDLAVAESDPSTMYVASATGGVWKTTDGGVTMAPVFERARVHSVGALGLFQGDPNVVWVGTGEATNRQSSGWGDGIYKSTDGGRTWANVGLPESGHVARIVTHPTNRDVVYVADSAKIGSPFAGLGAALDSGGHALFVERLGTHRTLDLIYTGELMSGADAVASGLFSRVMPADDLLEFTREKAAAVAAGPTAAFLAEKRLVARLRDERVGLWESVADETDAQVELSATGDYAEGFAAFREKRRPRFTGR